MAQEMTTAGRQVPQSSGRTEATRTRPVYLPRTDIYETNEHVVLVAEMPGVPPQNVDITLERRVLTIRGRAAEGEHAGYRRVYSEYTEGDYERVFTLSEDIDQDQIEASQNNGVLRLVLPKAAPAKARKIELKAS